MKVRPSVKPICEKCKVIRRRGILYFEDLIRNLERVLKT